MDKTRKIVLVASIILVVVALNGGAMFARTIFRIEDWNSHRQYLISDVITYRGETYRCIQTHTSQEGWEPPSAVSLWEKYDLSAWNQFTRYRINDFVTYKGGVYRCLRTHTSNRGSEPTNSPSLWDFWDYLVWEPQVSYKVGDMVMYRNSLYECRQAHSSQSDWAPDLTPALWVQVMEERSATVKLFVLKGNGSSAGADIAIKVDGQDVGTTDRHGAIILTLPSGTSEITAYVRSFPVGITTIHVNAGENYEHFLYLDERRTEQEDSILKIDELSWGPMPWNFDSFTLRFVNGQETIPLRSLASIEIIDSRSGRIYELDHLFEFRSPGVIKVHRVHRLRDILQSLEGSFFELAVEATDYSGYTHYDRITVYMGRNGLSL